jgi:hypothetical protein
MRNERSHPWGIDYGDPRLDLRRRAAEVQRDLAVDDPQHTTDLVHDDFKSTELDDWDPIDETRREGVAAVNNSR